jgi:hypothetical protein
MSNIIKIILFFFIIKKIEKIQVWLCLQIRLAVEIFAFYFFKKIIF